MTQGQVELYGFASPLKCVLDTAHPSVWAQTIDLFFSLFYRFFCINPIMFHILGHSDMCFTVISPILILMIPRCSNHSCSHSVIIATLIIILFRYPLIHNVCIVTIYIYIFTHTCHSMQKSLHQSFINHLLFVNHDHSSNSKINWRLFILLLNNDPFSRNTKITVLCCND